MINLLKSGSKTGEHRLGRPDPLGVTKLLVGSGHKDPFVEAKDPGDAFVSCGVSAASITPVSA